MCFNVRLHINCAPFGEAMEPLVEAPTVVFEVSVTSFEHDRHGKRPNYFRHPSVQHVIVVNAVEQVAYHYRRGSGREVLIGYHDTLKLDAPVSIDIPIFEFLPEAQ